MRLADGAEAIRGDLPGQSTRLIAVPSGAGSDLGSGVHRLSSIAAVRDELLTALRSATRTPITIGGDCGVELGAIGHAVEAGRVAVVWLDAHADLNTPATSPSGAFGGMVLRTILGDGPEAVSPATPLTPDRVILAGVRAIDDAESDAIDTLGIVHLDPRLLTVETLSAAIIASGAESVYLHIDLDVIDPAEFDCVAAPEPFGISFALLIELIAAARATLPLAGAGITGFAPGSQDAAADDLPSILRIVGALTRATSAGPPTS